MRHHARLVFYFETGSHEVAEASLSRERERERQGEREKERERELRLAANPDLPVSASQSTGITSVRHHARQMLLSLSNCSVLCHSDSVTILPEFNFMMYIV